MFHDLSKKLQKTQRNSNACANFISAKMNRLQKKKFSHEKFHGMKKCSRDNVTHIGLTQPARVQSRRDPGDELELGFHAAVHAVVSILVDT